MLYFVHEDRTQTCKLNGGAEILKSKAGELRKNTTFSRLVSAVFLVTKQWETVTQW